MDHVPPHPHSLNPTSEELHHIRQGDRTAFEHLLERWEDPIAALARMHRSCNHAHEDMQQVGRWALCRAADLFEEDGGASFVTYAMKVISNDMTDVVRRKYIGIVCGSDEDATDLRNAETIEYRDPLVEHEIRDTLVMWIHGLSARDQYIIKAVFYEDRTYQSVADDLGITAARVCQILKHLFGMARRLDLN